MPLQSRGDGVSIPEQNQVIISTSIDVLDEDGFNIGFLQQINRTDARATEPIRHLDSIDAGRIIERSPAPENVTLALTGFALYNTGADKKSLLNRLQPGASAFRSLNSQQIPFEITERWSQPTSGTVGETLYGDCLLTSYTRPVNIGTVTIAETANADVTWVE